MQKFYQTTASSSLQELIERVFTGIMQGGITVNLAGEEPTKRYGFAPDKSTEERVPLESVTTARAWHTSALNST